MALTEFSRIQFLDHSEVKCYNKRLFRDNACNACISQLTVKLQWQNHVSSEFKIFILQVAKQREKQFKRCLFFQ